MKRLIINLNLIGSFVFLAKCSQWSSEFIKRKKQVSDQSWQIYLEERSYLSTLLCLDKCRDNIYCAYASFGSQKCILYSEFAKDSLVTSSTHVIYEKINNQIIYHGCNSSNEYWSLVQKKCLSCLDGFVKYPAWPYNCYYVIQGPNNFNAAKTQCQNLGGFLISPRSRTELDFITTSFGIFEIWAHSSISLPDEIFKWTDGTRVGSFADGQPNNSGGNSSFVKQPALIFFKGRYLDVEPSLLRKTVCQSN
ncbi:hypothetical protein BpHYR1_030386 [Brachionus plicatilis]|uniref:C-type lectin domain-containing protein n=1 Tax=Brachionus plicatilis TaxID=10195 RepID=A0A3M7QP26_BRAPC|nr:hypothetical protein BpHYR1_030386 [Brachionus plicatilis]